MLLEAMAPATSNGFPEQAESISSSLLALASMVHRWAQVLLLS